MFKNLALKAACRRSSTKSSNVERANGSRIRLLKQEERRIADSAESGKAEHQFQDFGASKNSKFERQKGKKQHQTPNLRI